MIELFKNPNYDFIGKRKWAYYVSIAFTLLSLGSLVARGGLRYDIDFTGGTLMQARFEGAPSVAQIRASLFTAYFFTRLLFDLLYMGRRKVETISI